MILNDGGGSSRPRRSRTITSPSAEAARSAARDRARRPAPPKPEQEEEQWRGIPFLLQTPPRPAPVERPPIGFPVIDRLPEAAYTSPSAEWAQFGNPLMRVPPPTYTSPSAEWAQFGDPLMLGPSQDYRVTWWNEKAIPLIAEDHALLGPALGSFYAAYRAYQMLQNARNAPTPEERWRARTGQGPLPEEDGVETPVPEESVAPNNPFVFPELAPGLAPGLGLPANAPEAVYTSPSAEWAQFGDPLGISLGQLLAEEEKRRRRDLGWTFEEDNFEDLADYTYERSPEEMLRLGEDAESQVTAENMVRAPVTWESYYAMSQAERDLLAANSLLMDAREIDLAGRVILDKLGQEQYDADVETMFGSAGGSEWVAPKTVELLKSVNFRAVGQDLDEFLSLERAFTLEDIINFTPSEREAIQMMAFPETDIPFVQPGRKRPEWEEAMNTYVDEVRTDQNLAAVDQAFVRGVADTYKDIALQREGAYWDLDTALGWRRVREDDVPAGYGRTGDEYTQKFDALLNSLYDWLRDSSTDGMKGVWAEIEGRDWSDKEQEQLFDYIDQRTLREIQYGNPDAAEAKADKVKLRSPAEIRRLVGLPEVNGG